MCSCFPLNQQDRSTPRSHDHSGRSHTDTPLYIKVQRSLLNTLKSSNKRIMSHSLWKQIKQVICWTFLDTSINQICQLNEVFVLSVSSNEGITHCVGSCRLGNQVYIYTVHWLGYTLQHFYSYKSLDNINHESLLDNLNNEKNNQNLVLKKANIPWANTQIPLNIQSRISLFSFRNTDFFFKTYFGLLNSQLCP